jgi:CIC family chloride channel protein
MCVAAALLGSIGALSAVIVRLAFRGLQWCFTQTTHTLPLAAASLGLPRRALTPVIGAVFAAIVIAVHRQTQRRGEPPYVEYVEAVRRRHGAIPLLPNVWRTVSSAFSVATGASIGREGSMIQFAAAVASHARRRWRFAEKLWHALPGSLATACGVAGGVTAAYMAPVAGVFFALEIVLGAFSVAAALPLACAAAAGWAVSHRLQEPGPLYAVAVPVPHGWPIAEALLLAVVLGVVGVMYQRWLHLFRWLRALPGALLWGGLAVGLLSLADPRVWGNGDAGLADALGLHWLPGAGQGAVALLVLLALRLLATAIATGAGTVGGVFTPTLFTGATLGLLLSAALRQTHLGGESALLAIVAMAALIAAATHAPLMAAAMAAELTGEWKLAPLLLAACWIASAVAQRISPEALYAIASQEPVAGGQPRKRRA